MTTFIRGRIKGSEVGDQGTDTPVLVDSNGQMYVVVDPTAPISTVLAAGTADIGNVGIIPLASWQSSQWDVTASTVQIVTAPLTNRKTVSLKASCFVDGTGLSDIIYLGPSSGLTNANGYALRNGETIDLDLNATGTLYALTNAVRSPQNLLYVVEIA
jgi:hypothetical protein